MRQEETSLRLFYLAIIILVDDHAENKEVESGLLLQTTATVLGMGLLFLGVLPGGLLAMARKALAALLII